MSILLVDCWIGLGGMCSAGLDKMLRIIVSNLCAW